MTTIQFLAPIVVAALAGSLHLALADDAALRKALTLHAPFDGKLDAAFASGDARLYSASTYKSLDDAKPGLHNVDVEHVKGRGRFGDALRFVKKNTKAVYYQAAKNVAYAERNFAGTVSFWLSLDPERDLEPGFCDPVQVTDKAYNDAAFWVDFTKDEKPRHFRLGVFGDLKAWNPNNVPPDKNPDFLRRLVVVTKTPFARERWTNVTFTWTGLNTEGRRGAAKLYLNGELQGTADSIGERFTWNPARAAIRLGVNYVGLFDELSTFNRELTAAEVKALYGLKNGVAGLR
ncbi:MAG: LamG-like jellyroll fold domain-containing protein [Bryobacteraceae bacterium]